MPATGKTTDRYSKSRQAFTRARAVMPGGVSSPVRAFQAVGGQPVFVKSAQGAVVTDLDGHNYYDYILSYGPLILGHAAEHVLAAVSKTARKGTSFGMPTELETELAELIISALPAVARIRFVSSGTEATMSAIRLARAFTGRPGIIKCTGCYHGHSDALLVQAGSGATTLGVPSSPGVPPAITSHTLLVPFNDLEAVERVLTQTSGGTSGGGGVAAMIVEPIAGNMGTVPPAAGYLAGLRSLCDRHGALLIFDEVMSGFRVAWGGAQNLYGIQPDLTCLGKTIGGGLPCAAYGGRADIMQLVAPEGPVYQAGTLSGNPLAMAAGLATLESLQDPAAYARLEQAAASLEAGLKEAALAVGVPLTVQRVGSMITPFFSPDPVRNYEEALKCDTRTFGAFFQALLDRGIMVPPSQFETWFLSTAHDQGVMDATLSAVKEAFAQLAAVQ